MSQKDGDGICYLLKECGGSVYQWERLKIGIYALSKGRIDDLNLENIFSYKFDEMCYAGPADSCLESDISSMIMTGYINKQIMKLPNHKTNHEKTYLLERGIEVAEKFEKWLSRREKESVKEVAEKLKDVSITVDDLLNGYCKRWSEQAVVRI